MPIHRICGVCERNFKVKPSVVKKGGGKYCSQLCTAKAKHNRIEVECKECDSVFKTHPSEEASFCSRECYINNVDNPNGRRKTDKKWRLSILQRDKFICTKCNTKGGELQAHHINSYKEFEELRKDINNGSTLCKSCHISFHKQYGYEGFTDVDFCEYLSDK